MIFPDYVYTLMFHVAYWFVLFGLACSAIFAACLLLKRLVVWAVTFFCLLATLDDEDWNED